jgi:Family of unknown function (DUF6069)
MTATITAPTTVATSISVRTNRKLWRTGAVAGVVAAGATAAYAGIVSAAGVSLAVGGEDIPVLGFAQLTFMCALVGTAIAVVLARRARHAQQTFVRTTVALTVLSLVPDVFADAPIGTRIALAVSHVVAAAIVIPALATRLAD